LIPSGDIKERDSSWNGGPRVSPNPLRILHGDDAGIDSPFFFSSTVHLYGRQIRDWLVPRKSYIVRICNGSERRKWNSRL